MRVTVVMYVGDVLFEKEFEFGVRPIRGDRIDCFPPFRLRAMPGTFGPREVTSVTFHLEDDRMSINLSSIRATDHLLVEHDIYKLFLDLGWKATGGDVRLCRPRG